MPTIDYDAELAKLGNTPDAVAKSLRKLRCKGYTNHGYLCPLALFAERKLRLNRPWVANGILDGDDMYPGIRLPRACRQFVRRFDRHEYPELEV